MNKILVYGTLRQGDYNFDRIAHAFGSDSIKKVGEASIPNYKLFNLGFYPGINKSDNENDVIVCDVLEVNDQAKRFIDGMEFGAGYKIANVNLNGENHEIYEYKRELNENSRIKSGDWFKK